MTEKTQDWKPFDERPLQRGQEEHAESQRAEGWQRGDPIGYIREEIPEVGMPVYEGEWYERLVPDTLDVAERANLAVRFLTRMPDPDADYEVYFWVILERNPPVMWHDFHGAHIQPLFMEALPLLRSVTGRKVGMHVDRGWMEAALHMQGEDGLIYMPARGRPWARDNYHTWDVGEDGSSDQLASIVHNGFMCSLIALYYSQTGQGLWKTALLRLVDRLAQLMVYKEDFCYPPVTSVNPGAIVRPDAPMPDPDCRLEAGGLVAGWIILGLCRAYQATGYEPSLDLAGRLAVYLMRHCGCYDAYARFLGMAHTHQHCEPLIGLLDYGLISGNTEMIGFARKGYEYARSCGSPTIGYYPPGILGPDTVYDYATIQEYSNQPSYGCATGDMVVLPVKLSQAGTGDYWDDVDRIVRNHFFERQMLRSDWIERVHRETPVTPVDENRSETADRVVERHVGAFATLAAPNEFYCGRTAYGRGFIHCCSGNLTRAIYHLWNGMLEFQEGELSVNLLLNRASPWADVDSYIPYEGRVDVHVKQSCRLQVRIPEWVKPEETACTAKEERRPLGWEGRYAQVGAVQPGDVVTLTFPIAERTVKETIAGVEYTLIIKGNEVVHIDPPGRVYPLYQRAHYRENQVRWVKRKRFVPHHKNH